jgi:tripartite-type tricarboxylate transporter receptor subunit TctC
VRLTRALLAGVLGLLAAAAAAAEGADFFDGRRITYIVATKPGGGYDTYGRLVAKYLEKHLPGSELVVRNVPGAGNIIGANELYAARPDGLTIGTFNTGLIYAQLLQREGVKFDLRRMSWIGKAAADPRALVVGNETGLRSIEDLRNAESPILLASSGIGSASNTETTLLTHALGLNVKVILGYMGKDGEMGILRGEVAGTFASYSSLRPFVDNGFGRFLFHVGGDEQFGASVPSAETLVKGAEGRTIVALVKSQAELGRLTAGPPGIPADRLEALRSAYAAALDDPALRAEAQKLQIPIVPLVGEDLARRIDAALDQSPETIELVATAMGVTLQGDRTQP